jgi:hypothetical protein
MCVLRSLEAANAGEPSLIGVSKASVSRSTFSGRDVLLPRVMHFHSRSARSRRMKGAGERGVLIGFTTWPAVADRFEALNEIASPIISTGTIRTLRRASDVGAKRIENEFFWIRSRASVRIYPSTAFDVHHVRRSPALFMSDRLHAGSLSASSPARSIAPRGCIRGVPVLLPPRLDDVRADRHRLLPRLSDVLGAPTTSTMPSRCWFVEAMMCWSACTPWSTLAVVSTRPRTWAVRCAAAAFTSWVRLSEEAGCVAPVRSRMGSRNGIYGFTVFTSTAPEIRPNRRSARSASAG